MKKLLKFIVILFIILVGFLGFLLESKQGLVIALDITNKIIPGQLTYKDAQGKLGSDLSIRQINYTIDNTALTADNIQLQWHWLDFLTSLQSPVKVSVNHFKLAELGKTYVTVQDAAINGLFSLNKQSDLKAELKEVNYIASPEMTITTHDIVSLITGNYNDYKVNAQFKTTGTNIPDANWQLQAEGSTDKIASLNLTGKLLNGSVNLTGDLTWLPLVTWNAKLTGNNLQTQQYWPDIPSQLQMTINSNGKMDENNELSIVLNIQDVSGYLMNHPILMQGQIAYLNKKINIHNFYFTSVDNSLKANGSIADTANLQITANLPAIGQFLPDFSGSANANIAISGQGDNPYINANINLNQLKTPQAELQSAKLTVQGNALAPKPLKINLSATNLQSGEHVFKSINAALSRQNNMFHLNATANGNKVNATIIANARQIKDTIHGQLGTFTLSTDKNTLVTLKSPVQFQFSPTQVLIIPNCVYTQAGKTCIEKFNIKKQNDTLNGDIQLTANDFSYLAELFPQLENPKGNLAVNMHLAGTLEKPIITGKSTLNAAVTVPYLKVTFSPITINVTGDSNGQLKYTGSIVSKTTLTINGNTNLANNFATDVKINGNNFQVINNNEANILVSPTLDISYKDKVLNLSGNVDIPYAKITPIDFTSTVTLPSDVVMVTDKQEQEPPLNIYTDVTVNLGDKIFFSYAGLSAKLSGGLTILDKPGGDTTATGTLTVDKGQYKAYGQDLTIRDGKLIYTGGSITNPGLNIEATRTVKVVNTNSSSGADSQGTTSSAAYSSTNQLVGIRLQGTIDQPKLTLFSDPAGLSQSDILSYIVLGRGTGKSSAADAGSLLSALSLLNVGSHSENNIKNQLDQSLGLDVGLDKEQEYDEESGGVVDNTSLSLGKSLSNRLYMNYSIGIIVPINILTITYKLTEKLSLQSQSSSQGAGVDIFYHYSRD